MNTQNFRKTLTYFVGLCYLVFLAIDFFIPEAFVISSAIKFVGLLSCVMIAVSGEDAALRVALLLTAMCDYLLLFTDAYVPGVFAFACVQAIHAARHAKMAGWSPARAVLPFAALSVIAALIAYLITGDPLIVSAAAYGGLLLTAAALAVASYLRGKAPYQSASFAAGGMLLFVVCDVCVAALNLGVSGVANLMWLFYLPSQWLLANSGRPAPAEAPREKPPGWHERGK